MTLAVDVPERLSRALPGWIDSVLAACELRRADRERMGDPRAARGSWTERAVAGPAGRCDRRLPAVLRGHGNMSSPTVLFILDRQSHARRPRPWVALAFGPGLAVEAMIVT